MDEENIQRLTEVLGRLTGSIENTKVEFDEYGNQLSAAEARTKQIENARIAAIEKRIAEEEAAFNRTAEKWAKYSKATVSTIGSMTTQAGAFKTLTNIVGMVVKTLGSLMGAIPVLGAALKGMADGAADAIQLIADTTYKAFETFGKISGSGVVSNFENMVEASKKTGLLYGELEGVLAKNSEALAAFGKTALDGSGRLQNILKINNESNERFAEQFQKIGISFSEFAEYQASYVAQQTKAGFLKGKDDAYIAEHARKYAEELDTLSKLTGKSRSEIQKEQERLLTDARYRAKLVELESQGEEGKKKADEIRNALSVVPKNMQEGFKDMIAADGAITTKAAQQFAQMVQLGGGDAIKLASGLTQGTITAGKAYQEIINSTKKYIQNVKKLGTLVGDESSATALLVEAADVSQRTGDIEKDKKEIEEKRKEIMKSLDPMAAAATKSHELANKMELLLTSTRAVPAAINFMADRVKDFGKFLEEHVFKTTSETKETPTYGIGGNDSLSKAILAVNADLNDKQLVLLKQVQEEYREAVKNGTWLQKYYGVGLDEKMQAARDRLRLAEEGKLEEGGTTRGISPKGLSPEPHSPVGSGGQGGPELAKIYSKSGPSAMVGKSYAPAFQSLIDYLDSENYKIYSLGGYVDRDVRGKPGVKSVHSMGGAIDINPAENPMGSSLVTDMPKNIGKVAASLGLGWGGNWTSTKDAMHFSAATNEGGKLLRAADGALVQPKTGGTLVQVAEAGKPEAIVPLPNGRSIPVTITNQQNEVVIKNLESLSSKFESIIDLLAKNNNIKGNLIQVLA